MTERTSPPSQAVVEKTVAIRVRGLSKSYAADASGEAQEAETSALKDVSFEVMQGESVGVIGANGSGKSTLLRILAGVTLPSAGTAQVYGRVASILDIGAGFHPDLSGRENVYLNGRLLGFADGEIDAQYAEIVSFSGIGPHMDVAVKNYSNGMYLRLAFSIMAILEFDIYLLDEVLNVGDAAFRDRIRQRMNVVRNEGKTILYVSHNLGEIVGDFDSAIILEKGRVVFHGTGQDAVRRYVDSLGLHSEIPRSIELTSRPDPSGLCLTGASVVPDGPIDVDTPFAVNLRFFRDRSGSSASIVGIVVHDTVGGAVMTVVSNNAAGTMPDLRSPGHHEVCCEFPGGLFAPGTFSIDLYFCPEDSPEAVVRIRRLVAFRILEVSDGRARLSIGPLRPKLNWHSYQTAAHD